MSATSARKFREREDATIYIGAGGGQRPAGAEGGPGCTGTPTSPQFPPPRPPIPCGDAQRGSPDPRIPPPAAPVGVHPTEGPDTLRRGHPTDTPLPPVPISSAMWGCTLGEKDLTEPRGCPNLGVPPLHLHCAHLPSYHGVTSPAVPPECTHGCPAGGWGTTMCVCVCVCVLGGEFGASPPHYIAAAPLQHRAALMQPSRGPGARSHRGAPRPQNCCVPNEPAWVNSEM